MEIIGFYVIVTLNEKLIIFNQMKILGSLDASFFWHEPFNGKEEKKNLNASINIIEPRKFSFQVYFLNKWSTLIDT